MNKYFILLIMLIIFYYVSKHVALYEDKNLYYKEDKRYKEIEE